MSNNKSNTLEDFLELIRTNFSNKSTLIETEVAPFYAVGNKFGFPKELINLYIESLIVSFEDSQIIHDKYEVQIESEIDNIINSELNVDINDLKVTSKADRKDDKSLDIQTLVLDDEIPYKSKYLLAFWNKLYPIFEIKNNAFHNVLVSLFDLKQTDKIPFYKVYELYKTKNLALEKIISSPNGVGINKVLELKRILSSVIQESALLDSYVNQNGIDKKLIDYLFKIDAINEKNINFLIDYKSKKISEISPFPIFWLFDLYLISISKSNENHYFIYKSILTNQEYSDETIAIICNLNKNRVQQLRSDFLLNLPEFLNDFKLKLSSSITLDFFQNQMGNYLEYEKMLFHYQNEQGIGFRVSFCNVLLSYFNENLISTGQYIDLFRYKKVLGKKTIAIHLLGSQDLMVYNNLIDQLESLSIKNSIRNLFNYKIDCLQNVQSQYLRDIIRFEFENWSFRTDLDSNFLSLEIAVDFENKTITRVDVQNIGVQELFEISDFVNDRNYFNTLYNEDLKLAFSDNNSFGYNSRFNISINRHLEQLGFLNIASKWVRKSYILQFVSEDILSYKRCNFKDLIVELIKFDSANYNGKSSSFWLKELNKILEHNYKRTNNISAILKDHRVRVDLGLIYLNIN